MHDKCTSLLLLLLLYHSILKKKKEEEEDICNLMFKGELVLET